MHNLAAILNDKFTSQRATSLELAPEIDSANDKLAKSESPNFIFAGLLIHLG